MPSRSVNMQHTWIVKINSGHCPYRKTNNKISFIECLLYGDDEGLNCSFTNCPKRVI